MDMDFTLEQLEGVDGFPGQLLGDDGRYDTDDHQGENDVIIGRQLENDNNGGYGGVGRSGHQPAHGNQGIGTRISGDSRKNFVDQRSEGHPRHGAYEEGRGEYAARAA